MRTLNGHDVMETRTLLLLLLLLRITTCSSDAAKLASLILQRRKNAKGDLDLGVVSSRIAQARLLLFLL